MKQPIGSPAKKKKNSKQFTAFKKKRQIKAFSQQIMPEEISEIISRINNSEKQNPISE